MDRRQAIERSDSIASSADDEIARFARVDLVSDPGFFIRVLDVANREPSIQACKRWMLRLLDVKCGQHILDVGCGVGEDAFALARLVGASGQVTGLDISAAMLAEARRRAAQHRVSVQFLLGDAHHLDFPAATFDACRAERVLMYLEDPRQALAEMVRVTRPGGRVVVWEPDNEGVSVDHPDVTLTRRVVRLLCDAIRQGRIGRQLLGLFRDVGLVDVAVLPHTVMVPFEIFRHLFSGTVQQAAQAGVLSPQEVALWWRPLEQAAATQRFFAAMGGFIVSGRKPA